MGVLESVGRHCGCHLHLADLKYPVGATDEICIGSGDVDGDGSEF